MLRADESVGYFAERPMRQQEPEHRMPWAEPWALQPRVGGRGCGVRRHGVGVAISGREVPKSGNGWRLVSA